MRGKGGFSLIEALAALAVAAVAFGALINLQRQIAGAQLRYETAVRSAELERGARLLLASINPEAEPSGTIGLPPRRSITWTSKPLTPLIGATAIQFGDGDYLVRLRRLQVRIVENGQILDAFPMDRVGWRPKAGLAQ